MQKKDSVSAAIMALNADDRQIIVLYYYQELSVKEIARVIGKSENTIIQRLNRARGKSVYRKPNPVWRSIVQDTVIEEALDNYVSEKVAVFVADGIRYRYNSLI